MENTNYAGFWLRFVAAIIDGIIIAILQSVVIMPILAMFGLSIATMGDFNFNSMSDQDMIGMFAAFIAFFSVVMTISFVIQTFYFTLMESSKNQATVGKLALGLKVTDRSGNKLDFTKALLRQLGKIISGMVMLIGYIMAGLTEKKQALHDMIAGALVVKK
jgi:uncharacterized RDD family membrane protein YckC